MNRQLEKARILLWDKGLMFQSSPAYPQVAHMECRKFYTAMTERVYTEGYCRVLGDTSGITTTGSGIE